MDRTYGVSLVCPHKRLVSRESDSLNFLIPSLVPSLGQRPAHSTGPTGGVLPSVGQRFIALGFVSNSHRITSGWPQTLPAVVGIVDLAKSQMLKIGLQSRVVESPPVSPDRGVISAVARLTRRPYCARKLTVH